MKYYRSPCTESKEIAPLEKGALSPKQTRFFLSREIEAKASRSVCRPRVSECSVSFIRVLGKAARVRTDAMEKQDHVDRGGLPKTPMMRFV
jgi:hypothetical protein